MVPRCGATSKVLKGIRYAEFDGLDLYHIDDMLSDEERMVRDTVREWVDDRILPHIEQWAWDCHFPRELVAEMGALDLLGAPYSEYGLPGVNAVTYGLINHELERGDSGLRSFVSVQTSLVMFPDPSVGQPRAAGALDPGPRQGRGDRLLRPHRARLRLQPRRHADAGGARRLGLGAQRRQGLDHQRLASPTSPWCGRAPTMASAASSSRRGTPGFSTIEHKGKYSLRASVTSELVFEDCRLPGGRHAARAPPASRTR